MDGEMSPNAATTTPPSDEGNESPSVFLSKEALGEKPYKKGDTITLTVVDVDPETGDIQAELASASGETMKEDEGYEAAFDRAMPPETEQEEEGMED